MDPSWLTNLPNQPLGTRRLGVIGWFWTSGIGEFSCKKPRFLVVEKAPEKVATAGMKLSFLTLVK